MNARTTLVLVSMVSTTSATGCYSTWDLTPHAVWSLNGFRANDTIKITSSENEPSEFTRDTELRFRWSNDAEAEMSFRKIFIQGPHFIGEETESGKVLHLDLSRIKSVQARNFSAGLTALATIVPIGVGVPLASVALFVLTRGSAGDGRALRIAGRASPVRAPLAFARERGRRARVRDGDEATRAKIFAHWANAASAECASIPAFLALARDLKKAGAPQGLIDAAVQAAREEATHTTLCTTLANGQTSNAIVPWTPATPVSIDVDRESLLRRLALESFWDGSVAEGAAAAVARRSAPLARDEFTRLALQTIARDETNHAELAKHVVEYALDAGGRSVRDTLMESFELKRANEEAEMSAEIEDVAPEPPIDETLARAYGLAGSTIANAARIEAWEKSVAMLP